MNDQNKSVPTTNGGEVQDDALDPLEVVLSQLDKYENVQAAINDLVRLKEENKI